MAVLTKCQELEENLRLDILSGKLPGRRRIPSESVLAARYSICRSTVRKADRIAVIDEHGIVEMGSHEELLAMDGEYKKLHDLFGRGGSDVMFRLRRIAAGEV